MNQLGLYIYIYIHTSLENLATSSRNWEYYHSTWGLNKPLTCGGLSWGGPVSWGGPHPLQVATEVGHWIHQFGDKVISGGEPPWIGINFTGRQGADRIVAEVFTKLLLRDYSFVVKQNEWKTTKLVLTSSQPVKTRSICWKSLLKQTLEHKASPQDGELCFNFSSPKMQMITLHPRKFNMVHLKISPWKSGDSGGSPGSPEIPVKSIMASGSSPSTLFFILHGGLPSHHFFRPMWCFEITKTARCFRRVIFCWRQDLFFQRWTLCTRIASNKTNKIKNTSPLITPLHQTNMFPKKGGHFKKESSLPTTIFLGRTCFFSGEYPDEKIIQPISQLSSKSSDLVRAWVGGVTMLPEICTSKTFLKIGHTYCWWFRNPVNSPVEGTVVFSHYLPGFLYIQTVVVWDVFHQQ